MFHLTPRWSVRTKGTSLFLNNADVDDRFQRDLSIWPLTWWEWLLLFFAVAIFLGQTYFSAQQKSAIFDEQYHLAAGYSYLRTGDTRMATNHPPLMGTLAALPLLNDGGIILPVDHPSWETADRFLFSDVFLWERNENASDLVGRARLPIMLIGLFLLFGIFAFARQLFGAIAGWLVFILALFDPNLLAHSRFITTDLGLTCFLFLATWQLWRFLDKRRWYHLVMSGFFAGLAMSAKYTGLLFWPSMLLVLALYPAKNELSVTVKARMVALLASGFVAVATLWIIYGFEIRALDTLPVGVPVPAASYWENLYNTFFRITGLVGARLDFFLGEASNEGWRSYFPVALSVKTPLPTLILTLAGLVLLLARGQWRRQVMLWALPLLFLLLGFSGILTIGYRHMLPALPFLLMWAGIVAISWPAIWPRPIDTSSG